MGDFGAYRGEEVRGFLASDDISTATEIVLRPIDYDGVTARALAAGERLVIDSITICGGATATIVTLFQDWDDDGVVDAGEEIFSASLAINGNTSPNIGTPVICRQVSATIVGKIKAKASAASVGVRIFFSGRITKA